MSDSNDLVINCDYNNVYPPSDDTYLILDYFKEKSDETYFDGLENSKIEKVLDVGTGTGIIALYFQFLKTKYPTFKPEIHASDILSEAIVCAKRNEKANNFEGQITFIHSDLFRSFHPSLKRTYNIIVFNPPYLPSSKQIKEGINKRNIDYSWDGGKKGFETLVRFLDSVKEFLNPKNKSYIYYISSSQTDLIELSNIVEKKGFAHEVVKKNHIFFEDIILNRLELAKSE